jgi:hypothetical protein
MRMTIKDYKPTSKATFTVSKVGEVRTSQQGNPFIECRADVGVVAFWGGKLDSDNIDRVQKARVPFQVTCECFKPDSMKYALWVPQVPAIIKLVEQVASPAAIGALRASQRAVSADDLAHWRRVLLQMLAAIDGSVMMQDESVASRIGRLARERKIPREVAALMRTITEMRNSTEYEAKVLSLAESQAVSGAWQAINEWASRSRITVDPKG